MKKSLLKYVSYQAKSRFCLMYTNVATGSERIKRSEKIPGAQDGGEESGFGMEVRKVDLANRALRTSPIFTTGVNVSSIRIFNQIRVPEIPITLRPLALISL